MILAGDLGGTKSNLGLFEERQGKLERVSHERYPSHEYGGVEAVVRRFLTGTKANVTAASFGIAGPVVNNRVHATNLPWVVDGREVANLLGLPRVRLLNDLEATGYGLNVLDPRDLETLHAGVPAPQATKVVLAAGTGLGECIVFWDGRRHIPMPTEGGHADFAPHTVQQADLWKFLKAESEFVATEMILSGRGFRYLHEFLNPAVRHAEFSDPNADPAPVITENALAGSCATCAAAVDLWVEIYGSEAGNLALRAVARGGIYIAGGIAVKILPKLRDGRFAAAVAHKEKLEDFLADIPVHVILNEDCPLLGAAYVAWKGL